MPAAPSTEPDRRLGTRVDLALLAVGSIVLRLPGYFADRHLTFDDGVFGASAVAMRAGGQPFRDVFSSQGPLFLPLVWIADLVGLRTANSPRLLAVGSGLVLVGAVYLAGRVISDRTGALLAAVLASASASILWVSGPLAADCVGLAFATVTMLLLLRWRDDVTTTRAVWLGLGIGATISVKALLGPVILPVALVLLVGRKVMPIVAGAVTAVGFHLLLWLPWGPGNVWDQAYAYHLDVAGDRTPGANLAKVFSTLGDRDLPVLVALGLAIAAIALGRQALRPAAEGRWTSPDVLLLSWLAAVGLVLLTEHPLWRPHVSQLIPPLVLLAARHRPPLRAIVVAAVLVAPYHLVHLWPIVHPDGYLPSTVEVLDQLRDLPEGALAISDDPGIVWRAGRRTPPDLVDASILRMETGQITAASLARVAADPDVCAVVVRSRVRWGSFADLPSRLADEGYDIALGRGIRDRVYVKRACHPTS
jgi:4-amino-4-deoxy-L-arabinose transferase-like glycosyltransferase